MSLPNAAALAALPHAQAMASALMAPAMLCGAWLRPSGRPARSCPVSAVAQGGLGQRQVDILVRS